MDNKEIGSLKIKLTVDADELHRSFDVIEQRIETLRPKIGELKVAAKDVGITTSVEAFLTSGNPPPPPHTGGLVKKGI